MARFIARSRGLLQGSVAGAPVRARLIAVLITLGLSSFSPALSAQPQPEQDTRYAEHMPLADDSLLLDGEATKFGFVLVGQRGHVLLSDDARDWTQAQSVPTRSTLTAVDFVGTEGWAVGHDSVILHTTDGGEHWERQYFAPERQQPFMDVYFVDADHGFAVGAYGLYLTTVDGGKTWTDQDVSALDDWHHFGMLKTPAGTLIIAGEVGIIYRSEDRGLNWETIQLPYEGSMFGLLQADQDTLLTFGLRGNAFQSKDDGRTWQPVNTGTTDSLFGGRVFDDGTIVLVGNGGTVLIREPGAGRFDVYQHRDGEALAGVLRALDGDLIVFGVNGVNEFVPAEEAQ